MSKKFMLLGALALASIQIAAAQSKVAVIKLQEGLLATAEIKKAQAELQTKFKPRQDSLEKITRELEAIQAKLQDQKTPPAEAANLQALGTRRQREAKRIEEDLEADFNRDRQEILGRAGQRMSDVVKKVAEEKSLDMVVDISNTIYVKPALDITNDIVAAYDKAYPAK